MNQSLKIDPYSVFCCCCIVLPCVRFIYLEWKFYMWRNSRAKIPAFHCLKWDTPYSEFKSNNQTTMFRSRNAMITSLSSPVIVWVVYDSSAVHTFSGIDKLERARWQIGISSLSSRKLCSTLMLISEGGVQTFSMLLPVNWIFWLASFFPFGGNFRIFFTYAHSPCHLMCVFDMHNCALQATQQSSRKFGRRIHAQCQCHILFSNAKHTIDS